jgi:hypothetical protein
LKIKTKIVSCHTADSKPVKQEVNGTVILPPLVFPGLGNGFTSTTEDQGAFTLATFHRDSVIFLSFIVLNLAPWV